MTFDPNLTDMVQIDRMETIWFGNIYEYRSAYFHDVMYSNNQPGKEGALLYRDRVQATSLALLYQRYRKFDKDCYNVENATFYNVFGTETVRIGRYKIPQTNEIVLCTTDPLTYTDMMRYFNSFPPVKYFRSQFMQQKRKRQYVLNTRGHDKTEGKGKGNGKGKGKSLRDPEVFFQEAVHLVEYGLFREFKDKVDIKSPLRLPIHPLPQDLKDEMLSSTSILDPTDRRISLPLYKANSQYFLEQLFQVILNNLSESMKLQEAVITIGGDGRMLNDFAVDTFLAVAAGNRVKEVKIVSNNIISNPIARLAAEGGSDLTILLSDPKKPAGLNGHFGVQLFDSFGDIYSTSAYSAVIEGMAEITHVSKVVQSDVHFKTKITLNDKVFMDYYFSELKERHDLNELRRQLSASNLIISFDCTHGSIIPSISILLKDLNLLTDIENSGNNNGNNDDGCIALLLNDQYRSDYFGKRRPVDSLELFNRCDDIQDMDLSDLKRSILTSWKEYKTSTECFDYWSSSSTSASTPHSLRGGDEDEGCPDFGFIYNSDGSSCDVITATHGIISANEIHAAVYEGADKCEEGVCRDALVLTIKLLNKVLSERKVSLDDMIQKHREKSGKSYSLQLNLYDVSVEETWNGLDSLMQAKQNKGGSTSKQSMKSYFPSYKTKLNVNNSNVDLQDTPDDKKEIMRLIQVTDDVDMDFDGNCDVYVFTFPLQDALARIYKTNERGDDEGRRCDIRMEFERTVYGTVSDITSLMKSAAAIAVGLVLSENADDDDVAAVLDKLGRCTYVPQH